MQSQDAESSKWFTEDVQPHESSLRGYLHRKFPELPDVDDLVQETYIRLIKARARGKIDEPKPFLFATARNAAFDFFRRRKIATIEGIADIDLVLVIDDKPGVAETVCNDQELRILVEAINSLPPRCRQVVALRKIQGLSHAEIAGKLGISHHTVNAQIANGMLRLRDFMRSRGVKREKP
jgi:RNA polymerase sigma-70 factor (ECF subfamily)